MVRVKAGYRVAEWPSSRLVVPSTSRQIARRIVIIGATGLLGAKSSLAASGFADFLNGVRQEALASGISGRTVQSALQLTEPNQRVIELDHHQPEFTLSWAEYRRRVLPDARFQHARRAFQANFTVLRDVENRLQVDPGIIVGIWGLESSFGEEQGDFNVCDALATLAFDGRRRSFFRRELMNALAIIDQGVVSPEGMVGSYAGAMGQPQFMPSAYLRFARAFDGGRRADIWRKQADVFASIANYLARSGWRLGEPWGQPVRLAGPVDASMSGRGNGRTLSDWQTAGVRRMDGRPFSRGDVRGELLLPDGRQGAAFLVYRNFDVIRRYNPSDFYALAVGLLGDHVA